MNLMGINDANAVVGQMPPQKKSLGQQDFLKLLIAQYKSQDPTQPKTNGDFLAQLAQFSTNDGITQMQKSIENLASSLQSNQALQASALVGRKVLVNSEKGTLGEAGDMKMAVNLPAPVDNLMAFIYSENGELVRKIPLGQKSAGFSDVVWNGLNEKGDRMSAGQYIVKVHGIYQGQEVAIRTMAAANVDSVSLGQNGDGLQLNVAGVGMVGLDKVGQITA